MLSLSKHERFRMILAAPDSFLIVIAVFLALGFCFA